jgi:phosphoglycolate phosphatase-like HAD superfamily hydrolase
MWAKNYNVYSVDRQKAYVRKDRFSQLKHVDGVIFDCDGVLVDIRESYNRAIAKTVSYVLKALTNSEIPERLVSDEVIYLFRKTGGFNNDWDTVYGTLMFILCSLPDDYRDVLKKLITKIETQQDPFERLILVRNGTKKELKKGFLNEGLFEKTVRNLKEFAKLLDASGIASVDKVLAERAGLSVDFIAFYGALSSFLHFPAEVGKSIIATAQEEFFCGAKLFKQTFGVEPAFNYGSGMIENEKIIVQPAILKKLALLLGGRKLGIASGSWSKPAKYVLGDLIEQFDPRALIFLENAEEAERKLLKEKGLLVNLRKPSPYSLLKAVEGLDKPNLVLYVGDSMEDSLMAEEASKTGKNFVFAGVYLYSGLDDVVCDGFLESGCDIVIPSVNDLPSILEAIRRG